MCNNNCCMCCQCNNNTHDEDNPQEITYTSVCNSDACNNKKCCNCCCCQNGVCEDDASLMVLGLSEKMEECCEEVHKTLEHIECEIEEINDKNGEQDEKIDDLYDREKFDFNKSVFNPVTQKIEFWHVFPEEDQKDPIHYTEWDIDASNFLKDWFVDDVKLISKRYLELTFNVDPATSTHHEPIKITIDLYDFIDPGLYYTKDEIDLTVSTINNNITNLANDLRDYKTYVSNTYETQVAAGNHINNVEYDQNDHHTLIFTKLNGLTITRTIPDADKYIQSGEYTGGNLVLTKNDNTTVTIPVPATNHIVGGSIDGRVITLTRENNGTPVTILLPADANTYPVSGAVSGNTLTITNSDNSTVPITLPGWVTTDNDHYVTSGTVDNGVLKLTRQGISGTVDITLPTDNDHYVTSGTVDNGVLKLTRQGVTGTVDITLPTTTDNDHYPTSASLSGNTLTISGNSGFDSFSVDLSGISGTTNVTYGGDTVSIQNAITSIENRLNALEGLWEINPSDSTQLIAKNSRSAKAAGFYDSTVS